MSTKEMRAEASRFRTKEEKYDCYKTVLITVVLALIVVVITYS